MPIVNILVSPRPMKQLVIKTVANGPSSEAVVGSGSYDDLFGTLWKLGWDDETLNLFKVITDAGGLERVEPLETFPSLNYSKVTNLSLAFDQAGRNVIAWEESGQMFVRQYDAMSQNYVNKGPFPGVDPIIYNEGAASYSQSYNNLILFYLSQDRLSLYYRLQSELYLTEHVMETYTEPHYLTGVQSLPYQYEIDWKLSDEVTTGYYSSKIYPITLADKAAATLSSFNAGVYKEVVTVPSIDKESLSINLSSFTTGVFLPVVITHDTTSDSLSGSVSNFSAGNYKAVVVVHDSTGANYDKSAFIGNVTPFSTGTYPLVVLVYTAGTDAISASITSFTDGSYSLA